LEKTINISHVKAHFSSLVAEVEAGREVVIARAGKPVAKLIPINKAKKRIGRKAGLLKGKIWIGPDFEDPLPDEILAAFRGEKP